LSLRLSRRLPLASSFQCGKQLRDNFLRIGVRGAGLQSLVQEARRGLGSFARGMLRFVEERSVYRRAAEARMHVVIGIEKVIATDSASKAAVVCSATPHVFCSAGSTRHMWNPVGVHSVFWGRVPRVRRRAGDLSTASLRPGLRCETASR
jgi:hypothetical protein